MTCIATDGKTMAADGQSGTDAGRILCTNRQKLTRFADGSIFGGAGRNSDRQAAIEWLDSDRKRARPKLAEFAGLRLMPDGEVRYYDEDLRGTVVDLPAAVGSGAELAIGAMLAGAAPKRAVEIASMRDTGSGGKVREMRRHG